MDITPLTSDTRRGATRKDGNLLVGMAKLETEGQRSGQTARRSPQFTIRKAFSCACQPPEQRLLSGRLLKICFHSAGLSIQGTTAQRKAERKRLHSWLKLDGCLIFRRKTRHSSCLPLHKSECD